MDTTEAVSVIERWLSDPYRRRRTAILMDTHERALTGEDDDRRSLPAERQPAPVFAPNEC